MKKALLILAFLVLVLAMFGGPSESVSGSYVANTVKSKAQKTISDLYLIDEEIREQEFIISTESEYNSKPVLISGQEAKLVIDLSFLDDNAFTRMESYFDYSQIRAYIKVNGAFFESVFEPAGFLTYSCSFSIPENVSGTGVLGYGTKNWKKETGVLISQSNSAESLAILEMQSFTL
jgi:hypothetical protein